MFPTFHKLPEGCGIEMFVSGVEEVQDRVLIVLPFNSSQRLLQWSKRMNISWS